MDLTVAVCTHNPSLPTLRRAIEAILRQLPKAGGELLLIDNNSSPSLRHQGVGAGEQVRIVEEQTPGLTAAREAAIANAKGRVILFVDDDNILEDGYVAGVLERFSVDSALGALGGAAIPEYEIEPPPWLADFEGSLAVRRYAPDFYRETTTPPYSDFFPIGAGLAVRRDLAAAYVQDAVQAGRIEGRRGRSLSSGEDVDLDFFVLWAGAKLAVSGALRLKHVIAAARLELAYFERLAASNVKSSMQLERKWSKRFGAPVYVSLWTSWPRLIARSVKTELVSPRSPATRIRRSANRQLLRTRLRIAAGQKEL